MNSKEKVELIGTIILSVALFPVVFFFGYVLFTFLVVFPFCMFLGDWKSENYPHMVATGCLLLMVIGCIISGITAYICQILDRRHRHKKSRALVGKEYA